MHFKHADRLKPEHHHLLERFADKLLLGIEPRGDHATGFVATTFDRKTVLDKKDAPAHDWIKERKEFPEGVQTVLLHTRFATKGSPSIWANNHPVFYGSVFTVHNGTIYNDDELFVKHELERLAEVDSEIIPAMLDKHTFEHADLAFAELGGGFATASIDPVRYPGTLVLGKGGTWPIVTYDTNDFIVWASTQKAIEDAWGAVLGTPPKKGYVTLGSGDVWIIENDKITKKPSAFKHQSYTRTTSWKGSGSGNTYANDYSDWDDEWEDWYGTRRYYDSDYASRETRSSSKSEQRTILDHEKLMEELRKTGKTSCVTYRDRTKPEAAKYLAKYGNNKWVYCTHCRVSVADPQVIKATKQYGDICIDCYAIAKATEKQKNTDVEGYLVKIGMRSDDYEKMEKFADLQTYIHNQALYSVARDTGVKRTLIDWIINRADLSLIEMDKTVTDLYCDLHDRYMEAISELWQVWATEDTDAEAEDPTDPYVTCAAGTHRESEMDDCEACLTTACGVKPFETEEKLEAKATVIFDNQIKKCMVCRRKPKAWLGTTHAWCAQHAHICHVKKCESKPVGTAPNNQRFCHTHSRGVKGFIADTDTEARKRAMQRA